MTFFFGKEKIFSRFFRKILFSKKNLINFFDDFFFRKEKFFKDFLEKILFSKKKTSSGCLDSPER